MSVISANSRSLSVTLSSAMARTAISSYSSWSLKRLPPPQPAEQHRYSARARSLQPRPILWTVMAMFKLAQQPEFNPYDNDSPVPDAVAGPWAAPVASGPLASTLRLPGSKSLTNRELVLAALANGPSLLRAPLHSRDTALMIEALRALGTTIEEAPATGDYGPDLLVTPGELEGGVSI